jgi:hypothetical protein
MGTRFPISDARTRAWAFFITHGVLPLITKMLTLGLFFFPIRRALSKDA